MKNAIFTRKWYVLEKDFTSMYRRDWVGLVKQYPDIMDRFFLYEDKNTNFNKNDKIHTDCITNKPRTRKVNGVEQDMPDPNFMILFKNENGEEVPVSSWYVNSYIFLTAQTINGNTVEQHRATMKSNLLGDYFSAWKNAYGTVRRGKLVPDCRFEQEPVSLSEIKTGEYLLTDGWGKMNWLTIFYTYSNQLETLEQLTPIKFTTEDLPAGTKDEQEMSSSGKALLYNLFNQLSNGANDIEIPVADTITFSNIPMITYSEQFWLLLYWNYTAHTTNGSFSFTNNNGNYVYDNNRSNNGGFSKTLQYQATDHIILSPSEMTNLNNKIAADGMNNNSNNYMPNLFPQINFNGWKIDANNNQKNDNNPTGFKASMDYLNSFNIKDNEGKVYKYTVTRQKKTVSKNFSITQEDRDNFYKNDKINNKAWSPAISILKDINFHTGTVSTYGYVYTIKKTLVTARSAFTLQLPTGREIKNSICSAITIPIPQIESFAQNNEAIPNILTEGYFQGNPIGQQNCNYSNKVFLGSLLKNLQGYFSANINSNTQIPNILDVALLPYCPVAGNNTPKINGINFTPTKIADGFITEKDANGNDIPSYPFWSVVNGNNSFSINNPYKNDDLTKNRKYTELIRLVAPNYNGVFQFNIFDNDGLDGFNVDMTIKPNDTFLEVQPDFGGLYGADFNDNRGLIIGGSMSMENSSNAYTQYVLNNKSYQQQFDRTIQNMNYNFNMQVQQGAIAQQITQKGYDLQMITQGVGAVTGGVSGAINGSIAGGSAGAFAGGVAGVAGGLLGMATTNYAKGLQQWGYEEDLRINKSLFAESVAMQKDMFNMNISNIKAQPTILNRNTSFNAVSKYFPFLEVYEALPIEKGYLENFFLYRNYAVNKYGLITTYMRTDEEIAASQITFEYLEFNPIRIEGLPTNIANEIREELIAGFYWESNILPPIETD